jgi:hypothetical protein
MPSHLWTSEHLFENWTLKNPHEPTSSYSSPRTAGRRRRPPNSRTVRTTVTVTGAGVIGVPDEVILVIYAVDVALVCWLVIQ